MITVKPSLTHWNYFLALESDLELVARYIEFAEQNFETYSIELAHLLLASASEIDVIMKQLCAYLAPGIEAKSIKKYKEIIKAEKPKLIEEPVYIRRYGLSFTPWINWKDEKKNPFWWQSYNNVKHKRNLHFNEANLKNALNSMGALLIANYYYYDAKFQAEVEEVEMEYPYSSDLVMKSLKPLSKLFRLDEGYYWFTDLRR